jgi:hypothetical protein
MILLLSLALLVSVYCRSCIPVFVICFNQPAYTRNMVNQLRQFTSRILLVDNNSTSPELLEYYDSLERDAGVKVIRMRKNYGHTVVLYEHLPINESVFAVTDPDLQLNAHTPHDMLEHLLALTEEFEIGKAGLALNIADALPWRQFNISPREWEKRFWTDRLNTIAVSRPAGTPQCVLPASTPQYICRGSTYHSICWVLLMRSFISIHATPALVRGFRHWQVGINTGVDGNSTDPKLSF